MVLQVYENRNITESIEAKYVFPLDEFCSVVGFEAFINGKHVVGEVKVKQNFLAESSAIFIQKDKCNLYQKN